MQEKFDHPGMNRMHDITGLIFENLIYRRNKESGARRFDRIGKEKTIPAIRIGIALKGVGFGMKTTSQRRRQNQNHSSSSFGFQRRRENREKN